MLSDPIMGLTRRPASDLVGALGASDDVRGWHDFETQDGNKFIAFFHDNEVDVFDLNAEQQTVTYAAGSQPYLALSGALRSATLDNDDTYVANRAATPAMQTDLPVYLNSEGNCGIIQILGGNYARNIQISLNGVVVATHLTVRGDEPGHVEQVRTTQIARIMEWLLQNTWVDYASDPSYFPSDTADAKYTSTGAMSDPAVWRVVRFEDVIYIENLDGDTFTLNVNDDAGNKNIKGMTTQVSGVEDLPRIAPHLYVARVAEKTDPEEDLWFKFIVEGQEDDLVPNYGVLGKPGYWQETVAPYAVTTLDASTMPHVLKYDRVTGDFAFQTEAWEPRRVGTDVSNPIPSFVDNTVNDISSFQGRLVFVAGSSVIMSRSNRNRDFWIGSASTQVDTDPIDVRSKVEASQLLAAVQHNKNLVVFSNRGQFVLLGNAATPAEAALVLTSSFEAALDAKPVAAGRNVYFATSYGNYTAMREFFTEGGTNINDSRPIVQHVQRYLVGAAKGLSASSNYNVLVVHTDADDTDLYIYQYIWSDTEKVQSAWHKWVMSYDIVYSFFDDELVYLVQRVGNEYYLLRLSLDVQDSVGVPYHVYLDQRFDVFSCYTQFLLPYDYLHEMDLVVVQGQDCPNPGLNAPIKSIVYDAELSGYVVTLKSSMLGGDVVVGTRYTSRYMPTMPVVKDADGVAIATGKLRLRAFLLSLRDTGYIVGRMLSKWGNGEPVAFNARTVGDIENVVGEQPIVDDVFTMPFRNNAQAAEVEFYTDSHLPATILDIEWAGQYTKRGRRISTGG